MIKLGFSSKLIDLIVNCISTTSLSVVINGTTAWLIKPQRGLRQICQLSPYLFIIYAEVFPICLCKQSSKSLSRGFALDKMYQSPTFYLLMIAYLC